MKRESRNRDFKTPEGYFEDFTDRLRQRTEGLVMDTQPSEAFKVPKGYFEGLGQRIETNVRRTSNVRVIRYGTYGRLFLAAASIATVLVGVWVLNQSPSEEMAFEMIATSDIVAYLEEEELDWSSVEISESLSLDTAGADDLSETSIQDEALLDYLNTHIESMDELNTMTDDLE